MAPNIVDRLLTEANLASDLASKIDVKNKPPVGGFSCSFIAMRT
jgi:hypothetical protein